MSDAIRIQCSCGCENWVAPQQRGLFIHCTACGTRMLALDKSTPSATSPVTQAAILANIPKRRISSSPFEAEDVLPGDDADLSIPDRLDNVHRREIEARSMFIKSVDVRDALGDETCCKCGKEIQGDWDRVEIATGVICYVCSNQGTGGIPERLQVRERLGSGRRRRPRVLLHQLPPAWRNPRWERFRRVSLAGMLVLMSFAVFAMTAYVSVFEFGRGDSTETSFVITASDLEQLSMGMWVVARTWLLLSEMLPVVAALFLVRFFGGSFASRNPLVGVAEVTFLCLPLLVIQLAMVGFESSPAGRAGGTSVVIFFTLSMLKLWTILNVAMDAFLDDWMEPVAFVLVLCTINLFAVPYLNRLLFHSLGVI